MLVQHEKNGQETQAESVHPSTQHGPPVLPPSLAMTNPAVASFEEDIQMATLNYKRTGRTLEKGVRQCSLHCCPIDIPPLINMEATGCRLAMTGHGTLTNHVRTVVEKNRRKVPASSDHGTFPTNVLKLIRAKNAALRRANTYPTAEHGYRARAFQRRTRDEEITEYLMDNIESQCSHASPQHDIDHVQHIEKRSKT
ncbi:hypothetical protein EVAR_94280_1 [Eumeta japonica]|uniref:Uncharacterized protein n=1 Tax=Eumeta variegata TaxID=151549 RepID=A0A4C1UGA4_EUMVA|nr:hypothetical protein EVAR_94280_1 [Eumeta japonica]